MAVEKEEVTMSGTPGLELAEAPAVTETHGVPSAELDEQRAAKRLKMDESVPSSKKDDPAPNLKEGPSPNVTMEDSAPTSNLVSDQTPLPERTNDEAGGATEVEMDKARKVDGDTNAAATDPRRGVALIKKEYGLLSSRVPPFSDHASRN